MQDDKQWDQRQVGAVPVQPVKRMSPRHLATRLTHPQEGVKDVRDLPGLLLTILKKAGTSAFKQTVLLLAQLRARLAFLAKGRQRIVLVFGQVTTLVPRLLPCGQQLPWFWKPLEPGVKLWQICMSIGNIILPGLPPRPEFTHSYGLMVGAEEGWGVGEGGGLLKLAALASTWEKVDCGNPRLRREMKKRLLTLFKSFAGPQGPLKAELSVAARPAPCRPSNATMSVSEINGFPFCITVSIAAHVPAALGKIEGSLGPLLDERGEDLPAENGGRLVVKVPLLAFLIPQARALVSASTQKSALLIRLKYLQLLMLVGLMAAVQASVSFFTKSSRPRLSVLTMLMEPSHPPMQSWKAARRNFLICILKRGVPVKKQLSMVCSMASISVFWKES